MPRTKKQITDPRDQDPRFPEYQEQWLGEIQHHPVMRQWPAAQQQATAVRMARSSVRFHRFAR